MKSYTIILFFAALSIVAAIDQPIVDLLAPLNELRIPSDKASAGKPSEFAAPQRAAKKTLAAAPEPTRPSRPSSAAAVNSVSSRESSARSLSSIDSATGADGTYQYAYESDTGIKVQEKGEPKVVNDVQTLSVQGGFSYTAPDGTPISMTYIADENGFQPIGDHLPTPPPIPEYIQRALLYIQSHPPKNENDA